VELGNDFLPLPAGMNAKSVLAALCSRDVASVEQTTLRNEQMENRRRAVRNPRTMRASCAVVYTGMRKSLALVPTR